MQAAAIVDPGLRSGFNPTPYTLRIVFAPGASIFSLLLIATGAAKLAHPGYTARALREMNMPIGQFAVRGLAVAEIAVGALALMTGLRAAFVVQGILYLAFFAWVWVAIRSGAPIESCGCLGKPDTPPYWGHMLVDGLGASFSFAAAIAPAAPIGGPIELVARLVIASVGAWLAWHLIGTVAKVEGLLTR
jgi:hypothetical protein